MMAMISWLLIAGAVLSLPGVNLAARTKYLPSSAELDSVVIAEFASALVNGGLPIPRVLTALSAVAEPESGTELAAVAQGLASGQSWEQSWEGTRDRYQLKAAFQSAWLEGVDPTLGLRHHIEHTLRRRVGSAKEQAAILGVKIVLPLGLCLLPAFVLLGLVPAMLSSGSIFG